MTYETIKGNFERGLWNEAMVSKAVEKGVISIAEYAEIVGTDYAGDVAQALPNIIDMANALEILLGGADDEL